MLVLQYLNNLLLNIYIVNYSVREYQYPIQLDRMYGDTFLKLKKGLDPFGSGEDQENIRIIDSTSQNNENKTQSKQQARIKKLELNQLYGKIVIAFLAITLMIVFSFEQSQRHKSQEIVVQLEKKILESECLVHSNLNSFERCGFVLQTPKDSQIIYPAKVKQDERENLRIQNLDVIKQLYSNRKPKFEFSKDMFVNWLNDNQTLHQLDYYRLDQQYNLQSYLPEKTFCIMSPFYNLINHGADKSSLHLFLKSLNSQNYSNFRVYMIDDASKDLSVDYLLSELPKYPHINNRITIIKNSRRIGALANRDQTIRNYCQPGEIILDIDGDDCLIGKQVLNMYNRIYSNNEKVWFVYTNFLAIKGSSEGDGRDVELHFQSSRKGPSKTLPREILKANSYRVSIFIWATSQLRSYLYDLYVKIPFGYLIDVKDKQYYWQASDRFTMYALVELAGEQHTFFYEEYTYFYYQPNFETLKKNGCSIHTVFYNEAKSRVLIPLRNLGSLDEQVKHVRDYEVPVQIQKYLYSRKMELIECKKLEKEKAG